MPVGPLRCLARMISDLALSASESSFVAVVVGLAVDEGDHVGILLDGAGLAQIAEHGALVVAAALAGAGELRERDDGDVQLLGQGLEAAGDGGDLLGAVLVVLACRRRAGGRHQLQVVDDDRGRGRRRSA